MLTGIEEALNAVFRNLCDLYGTAAGRVYFPALLRAIEETRGRVNPPRGAGGLDERDAVLITYPDMVREEDKAPLSTLHEFLEKRLSGVVTTLHILPFFPSSSDDGFSVIDYRSVDPGLGSWRDIERLHGRFRLMFDAVFNHVSAGSEWFKAFLRDDPAFREMFITVPETADLSAVTRPRSLPLLAPFDTPSGRKLVWTTFGPDQIDLNFSNPDVLSRMADTLLFYVRHGADLIRLDAVAYLWKRIGTRCIHLPEVHLVVRLFRAMLDAAAPHVALITETNVPHEENVSYFGDGTNEAQLVYNFPLPPLVLHTFHTGSAEALTRWAEGLGAPSGRATFLNFLASHDGIGVVPALGVLSETQVEALVGRTLARGGFVSYKSGAGGAQNPYELNVDFWDALADPLDADSLDLRLGRFLAAHAVMLSLRGVPALYFHALFGSGGWPEGVKITGRNRTINRRKCDLGPLSKELEDKASRRYRVFHGLKRLLKARASSRCFHPLAGQGIVRAGERVFAVLRISSRDPRERVLCLHNTCAAEVRADLDIKEAFGGRPRGLRDIAAGGVKVSGEDGGMRLKPYQVAWLAGRS